MPSGGDGAALKIDGAEHRPEPPADSQHSPFDLSERYDFLRLLKSLKLTFDDNKVFADALNYRIWHVVIKKFMFGCKQDVPVILLFLDVVAKGCEKDARFAAEVRAYLRKMLGDEDAK